MTRYRLRSRDGKINVYIDFTLTQEMYDYLFEVKDEVYQYVGVIIFRQPEDITCFMLKFNLHYEK